MAPTWAVPGLLIFECVFRNTGEPAYNEAAYNEFLFITN